MNLDRRKLQVNCTVIERGQLLQRGQPAIAPPDSAAPRGSRGGLAGMDRGGDTGDAGQLVLTPAKLRLHSVVVATYATGTWLMHGVFIVLLLLQVRGPSSCGGARLSSKPRARRSLTGARGRRARGARRPAPPMRWRPNQCMRAAAPAGGGLGAAAVVGAVWPRVGGAPGAAAAVRRRHRLAGAARTPPPHADDWDRMRPAACGAAARMRRPPCGRQTTGVQRGGDTAASTTALARRP
jgi:hypothetical protein